MSELNFCPECNNILYARADSRKQQLKYFCRQCDFSRWADSNSSTDNCIYRTSYNYDSKEDIFVSPLVIKDPTLGRTTHWKCLKCGFQKAVFFQLPERVTDDAMKLVFVCCNSGCGYWSKQIYDNTQNIHNTGPKLATEESVKANIEAEKRTRNIFYGDVDNFFSDT
ncbi:DNA-directed RNA polymerase II, putative [Theileria equi strain WA]|uniref:DNA-directed RNA polymerase II, putative n=1 Tax=Theileria equi strain WA TaxID=1537102 RepID=L0AU47_THEEQ|nr:DNA-directed RNA polymerase II, putative [Theileria equi strain WA]AFZ79075.1 DNA-directed RNA polymerase II, putative [Theileria equi strain WA]|eukprot:XP_004828741.1 DNA-directed RNA polymerase II, putative [Theileria equi strain WA]